MGYSFFNSVHTAAIKTQSVHGPRYCTVQTSPLKMHNGRKIAEGFMRM